MFSFLLLTSSFTTSFSQQYTCDIGTTEAAAPLVYTSNRGPVCPDGWFCGALQYDISYQVTGNDLYGISDYNFDENHIEITRDTYCADKVGCELYGDGTDGDGCKVAQWKFEYWQPTTCNKSADYNALTIGMSDTFDKKINHNRITLFFV